jgi:hypothetical protein
VARPGGLPSTFANNSLWKVGSLLGCGFVPIHFEHTANLKACAELMATAWLGYASGAGPGLIITTSHKSSWRNLRARKEERDEAWRENAACKAGRIQTRRLLEAGGYQFHGD